MEMVYSLLSMLGTHDKEDMSRTLFSMSRFVSIVKIKSRECITFFPQDSFSLDSLMSMLSSFSPLLSIDIVNFLLDVIALMCIFFPHPFLISQFARQLHSDEAKRLLATLDSAATRERE